MRNLILASLMVLLTIGAAKASDVYINGQKLGAVADIELQGVSVRFDSEGNIHISAPGYDIVAPEGSHDAERPEQVLSGTYCLVADTTHPGVVPFQFEVFVNSTKVGDLTSDSPSASLSLTEFVEVGKNRVVIRATYDDSRAVPPPMRRKSIRIRAGQGTIEGGVCTLSTTPVLYTRLARDTGDKEDTFTFVAR